MGQMAWNRDKWNQFVTNNTPVPPTDEAAKKAADEAKAAAAHYEEDIDLEALGIQRVKEYLTILASETPGSAGPNGHSGTPAADAITMVSSTKQIFSGAGPAEVLRYTFEPGELNGAKDLIKIQCCFHNLSEADVTWVTGVTKTIFSYVGGFVDPDDGMSEIWIAEASNPFDLGSLRSLGRSFGRVAHQYENVNVGSNWMIGGGDLVVTLTPNDPLTPWGAIIGLYKFVFPQVIIE